MKLDTLTLENYRGFKHFTGKLEPDVNILVGLNGTGKTSLLEAISIAYGQFMSGFATSTDRGIHVSETHLARVDIGDGEFSMEYQMPCRIAASTKEQHNKLYPMHWERFRNSVKKNTKTTIVREQKNSAQLLQKLVQDGANPSLPIIAYYGTDRLFNQNVGPTKKMPKLSDASRLEGYTDWLKPRTSYGHFVNWLYHETMSSFERELEIREQHRSGSLVKSNHFQARLDELQQALNEVLRPSGWSNVRYSSKAGQIVATHKEQGDVPINLLSDGVRNILGLVADIAYRAIRLNPHINKGVLKSIEGIVLVDEVDMHLHPQWQQHIVKSLQSAFPQIQFILTTHSPQVLGNVSAKNIKLINQVGEGCFNLKKPAQSYGLSSNDILDEVMNTGEISEQLSRTPDVFKKLEAISALISDEKYLEAEKQILQLEEEIDGEIPELVKAKLSIELAGWDD
ncbi:AAA family ATPase [Marinomonas sp. 2405UD66-6]|uniref:AAA family ATPase n=1 Tax=Marinomonas sp. 2405UD66-6 TaxID=3391834 RepID=UPI0039C8FB21